MDMAVDEMPDSGRNILYDSRGGATRVHHDGKLLSGSRGNPAWGSFGLPEYWDFSVFRIVDVHGGLQETWPRNQYRQVGEKA
jgi:hypothetical protein